MIKRFLSLALSLVVLMTLSSCVVTSPEQKTPQEITPQANKKFANTLPSESKSTTVPLRKTEPAMISFKKNQTVETPAIETKNIKPPQTPQKPVITPPENNQLDAYPLGIIGGIEPITIIPFKTTFQARIDTGATTSSINAENIKEFERDGKKWVSFDIVNPETKEKKTFRKRVMKTVNIIRPEDNETRYTVRLEFRFGDKLLTRKFTLANRSKFRFPVLIGRNVLAGLAVIDVTRKNTLK